MEKNIRFDASRRNWMIFIFGIMFNVIIRSTEPGVPGYTTYALTGGAIFVMLAFLYDFLKPLMRYFRLRVFGKLKTSVTQDADEL